MGTGNSKYIKYTGSWKEGRPTGHGVYEVVRTYWYVDKSDFHARRAAEEADDLDVEAVDKKNTKWVYRNVYDGAWDKFGRMEDDM